MLELIDMGFEVIDEINDLIADTSQKQFDEIAYPIHEVTF